MASMFPIFKCSSGQEASKSRFTSVSVRTPRLADFPENSIKPSAGFTGMISFTFAHLRATVPELRTLLIVCGFSPFSPSQREKELRSDLRTSPSRFSAPK